MRDPHSRHSPAPAEGWHLDKRIPVAFVFALIVQTGAALVWAGSARERMSHMEADVLRVQELAERSARLEAQVVDVRAALNRIEAKLDQLGKRSP